MSQNDRGSLRDCLSRSGNLSHRSIGDAASSATLSDLIRSSILGGRLQELAGRSILVATKDQFTTALALIELDGIARRLVVYPADLPQAHVPSVVATANVDTLVCDWDASVANSFDVERVINCGPLLSTPDCARTRQLPTEWVLLTSGTTGHPKLTLHTLASLTGAIKSDASPNNSKIWSTFYDIRRYGGLQIFLRALIDGSSLVLSSAEESTGGFLIRAGAAGVTHISGTPSHWRRALMSPMVHRIAPKYVRLSGEIVDQGILDNLRSAFGDATIVHAFASTEAGVGFDVRDGLAGFPTGLIEDAHAGVEMKIQDGSLRIRSARTAARYLGGEGLADDDGFVDTGDLVELHGDRYYFVGRRDGMINVGGAKVHPEEVEAVLNRHPRVRMSLVRARKNPITGAIVVADVVLKSAGDAGASDEAGDLKRELIEMCNRVLAAYKVPATIRLVPSLDVTSAGKLARSNV